MTAVQEFNANPTAAIAAYGLIADWDVSAITDMSSLFWGSKLVYVGSGGHYAPVEKMRKFNAVISNWDTSSVTTMAYMFDVRSSPSPAPNLESSPPLRAACTAVARRLRRPGLHLTPHCMPSAGRKLLVQRQQAAHPLCVGGQLGLRFR